MKTFDYLIVGQGVAGTLLDYFLTKHGCRVGVIDDHYERAASKVAAGLINPVTGRRYVKSWRVDTFLPFARAIYQELEEKLGISLYQDLNILRTLFNHREENDWLARSGEPAYEPYLLDEASLENYAQYTVPAFAYGEVKNCAQVDLPGLKTTYRDLLLREQRLKTTTFDYGQLKISKEGVQYGDWKSSSLVFCEGAKGQQNPYFGHLPFQAAKGEVLVIRIPNAGFAKALKHRVFIIPLGADLYWIGATYDWDYSNDLPTDAGRSFLEERLQDLLKIPFEVIEHRSSIRPTVKDRRPFLGRHPEFPNLIIFNGMGTKGTSLAPYWANHLVAYLEDGEPLNKEVAIQRFL